MDVQQRYSEYMGKVVRLNTTEAEVVDGELLAVDSGLVVLRILCSHVVCVCCGALFCFSMVPRIHASTCHAFTCARNPELTRKEVVQNHQRRLRGADPSGRDHSAAQPRAIRTAAATYGQRGVAGAIWEGEARCSFGKRENRGGRVGGGAGDL